MTEAALRERGFTTWDECLARTAELPLSGQRRTRFVESVERSRQLLANGDIRSLAELFPVSEQWRILGSCLERATFLDCETTGLSRHSSHVSVIAAHHRGALRTFAFGENLDDFLSLADEAELLVTFNGSSFDIPFLEKTFNIPSIGIPHIDLRWVAWHAGQSGGLKTIERRLGVRRPPDVEGIDGFEAVDLYYRWQAGDESARRLLLRYCAADVLCTKLVAGRLLRAMGCDVSEPDDSFVEEAIVTHEPPIVRARPREPHDSAHGGTAQFRRLSARRRKDGSDSGSHRHAVT